jgi:hypothetical protein
MNIPPILQIDVVSGYGVPGGHVDPILKGSGAYRPRSRADMRGWGQKGMEKALCLENGAGSKLLSRFVNWVIWKGHTRIVGPVGVWVNALDVVVESGGGGD